MNTLTAPWAALPVLLAAAPSAPAPELPQSDAALVAAALRGDDDAFAELVRRHRRRVFATAARFARDDHQLDDISQNVFLRAWKNLGKFRGEAPFEHWLARITISACYDFLRRERRVREHVSLDVMVCDVRDASSDAALTASRARELLDFAMAGLPAAEQLILTLCEIEEKSMREVAALTGWSEANVKVRAFRARQNLKRILEKHHES